MNRRLGLSLSAVLLSACGYFAAGIWEDDPRNWERAFGVEQPIAVVVVHSKYWRSPHWTLEFEYFFQVKADPALKDSLVRRRGLEPMPPSGSSGSSRGSRSAPEWFCPKEPGRYEAWASRERQAIDFQLFVDRETGDLFFTGQLL